MFLNSLQDNSSAYVPEAIIFGLKKPKLVLKSIKIHTLHQYTIKNSSIFLSEVKNL